MKPPCQPLHPGARAVAPRTPPRSEPASIRSVSGRRRRSGFSLLELILALAILALAVAAISQLVRLGLAHARYARELTKAELYCESTLAELAAGVIPLEGATGVPIAQDPEWLYSVAVEPAEVNGLLVVTVTVYQAEPDPIRPIEFTLVRWMADPALFSHSTAGISSPGAPGRGGLIASHSSLARGAQSGPRGIACSASSVSAPAAREASRRSWAVPAIFLRGGRVARTACAAAATCVVLAWDRGGAHHAT